MSRKRAKRPRRARNLTVYLFNVGQGDNILLRLPRGEYGIIDCFYDAALDLSEPPALTYLKRVRKRLRSETPLIISFICLSHPDYDHVKGVRELLAWIADKKNNVQLKNLWLWPSEVLEELIERYEEYAGTTNESDGTHRASEVGRQLRAVFRFRDSRLWKGTPEYLHDIRKLANNAGGVKAIGVAPLGKHVKKFNKQAQRDFIRFAVEGRKHRAAQQNLLSSVLMLIYGRHRLLFGGDTGSEVWRDCLNHYDANKHYREFGPLKGHFVKASHHGSKYSSSPELWTRILFPGAHVGISAGRKRSYQHPNRETLFDILAPFIAGNREPDIRNADCPKIVATNTCHACLTAETRVQQPLPKKTMEWMLSRRPALKSQVEEAINSDLAAEALPTAQNVDGAADKQPPPERLTAYVYRFGPGDAVNVYRGMSKRPGGEADCSFKTKTSPPFPLCGLREGAEAPAGRSQ